MRETRLLAVLNANGDITREDIRLVGGIQACQRMTMEKDIREKCGEIVVRWALATQEVVDAAVERQRQLRQGIRSLLPRSLPNQIKSHIEAGTVVLAGVVATVTLWKAGLQAGAAVAGLGALSTAVVSTVVGYRLQRKFWAALGCVLGAIGVLAVPVAAVAVVDLFGKTDTISMAHDAPVRESILMWFFGIRATVVLLGVMFLIAAGWAFACHRSARFIRARAGLLKDMMIRVGRALRSERGSATECRREAIKVVLDDFRGAMCLRERTAWRMGKSRTDAQVKVTTAYLVPDTSAGGEPAADGAAPVTFDHFRVARYSWHPKVSKSISDMFTWIRENHQPAVWNEERHRSLVEFARQTARENPGMTWEEIYRIHRERDGVGSLTGWVFYSGQVARSNNASGHLILENLAAKLDKADFKADTIRYARVCSFIACPVPGQNSTMEGVLLALKSDPNGFDSEDAEFAVAASQLIASITSSTR